MSSGTSVSNADLRQSVVFQSHDQLHDRHHPERPGYSPPEPVDLNKVLEVKKSGGSFGDAFGRPHVLKGEVNPKRGAAIDAQLAAEDKALLEQKWARKGDFGPNE